MGPRRMGSHTLRRNPGAFETIKVVDGSMEFNKRPDPTAFTIKYNPGTPISDQLRKLTTEFGRQPIGSRPTIAEAKKMLDDQVAQARPESRNSPPFLSRGVSIGRGFWWLEWACWCSEHSGFGGIRTAGVEGTPCESTRCRDSLNSMRTAGAKSWLCAESECLCCGTK